jgi:hypothetical protein
VTAALASRVSRLEKATADPATAAPAAPLFTPNPGPQKRAYESEADITGYGGSAGGGKSMLAIGLAVTQHRRSIIFRREQDQVRDLWEKLSAVCGIHGRSNENLLIWRDLPGGRYVRLAGVKNPNDWKKFQGQGHDLFAFDEGTEFLEQQIRTLIAWNRTTITGQRCRVVISFNPPTSVEGEWVIEFFAPWLDPNHPDPAEPGELRWYAVIDGQDTECEDGTPFEYEGETITPLSRTFFPARLEDNPQLEATGYRATLQGLPEPLRSQMLYGDFTIGLMEDAYQVIPTAWVRAAQARWTPDRPELPGTQRLVPQSCVSLDVAEGGRDRTVVARRYGDWVAPLIVKPGVDTPTPEDAVAMVEPLMLDGGYTIVDVDGLGGKAYGILRAKFKGRAKMFQGVKPTLWRDKEQAVEFLNIRAAAYWAMREALDPSNNSAVALPPDPELRAELCSARWERRGRRIKLEDKEKIKERLGRSPDKADAVVQAFWPNAVMAIPESYGIRVG